MAIENYNECNEIFWDAKSFNYSLEEDNLWDVEKYWKLEYFLIKLCKALEGDHVLHRDLAANLYYLSFSINNLIGDHKDPLNGYEMKNFDEDEADYCRDRLNHIMRILWGRIPLNDFDYMLHNNPLFQKF